MAAYRFDDGPVKTWWRDEPFPDDLRVHAGIGGTIVAHSAPFERTMWNVVLRRQVSTALPPLTIAQMDCTQARARAIGLPADLERAAKVTGAAHQKDTAGGNNMLEMASPQETTFSSVSAAHAYWAGAPALVIQDDLAISRYQIGTNIDDVMTLHWLYDDARRAKQTSYCVTDVLAECGVDLVVPHLSPSERALWGLDQKINDRGVMVDAPFIERLVQIVDIAARNANRHMWTLTNGAVKKCTENAKFKKWLNDQGVECDSVKKGDADELIATSRQIGKPHVAEAIALRNAASKSSTAKFKRALACMGADRRIRGQFVYHAASPGRWAGATVQLQNLVRVDEERELPTIRHIVAIVEAFDNPQAAHDLIEAL